VSFRSSHPRVVEKRSELEKVRQKLEEESARIIGAVRTEYALNRDQETGLAREIARTKEESLRARQKTSSYETLASDASETRRLFDLFNTRIKEISLNTELLTNNIRVLDHAVVPKVPVRPNKLANLLIGAVLGLGLGVGAAFLLDYLDNTVKSPDDVEKLIGVNALAVLPRALEETQNAAREAMQTLRTSLLFSSRNRADRVLLLTSAVPREGKTTTTIALARTLAAAGDKVCVLDCDLRRPTLHVHLSLRRQLGLTNYLMSDDEAGWRAYVKATDIPGVSALTCGAIPPNPPQVFGGERFLRLLQTLKSSFDWVLVDSPPVGALTDAIILASMVDMVLLVIRAQHTDRGIVSRAAQSLRNVSANVIGAVLNDVDPQRSHYKSYYDYNYYLAHDGEGVAAGAGEGGPREAAPSGAV
jgi:capsular exopolysaccharide synthesis family protein